MFCWGDGAGGQLVLPVREESDPIFVRPTLVNSLPEQFLNLSCGEQHSLFVTVDGRVLSCGRNSKGQLGRKKSKDTKLPVVEGLGGVVAVACGQDHSLALCESGQVYSWGAGSDGQLGIGTTDTKVPTPVNVPIPSPLPIPVVQVACGNFHSLALSKGGEVFSWGLNSYGQLGLGKAIHRQLVPALVRSLTGVPVTKISAGGAHTLVLTLPGLVYCCGSNKSGQLGLNRVDENGRFTVCAVPALRSLGVCTISCGEAHTAVLTKDGEIYTFGDGTHGQLGHNSTNRELRPRKVDDINKPAKKITCGSHHTLVLLSSGILLAFGSGVKGQLGNGSRTGSLRPTALDCPWNIPALELQSEIKLASGWNSNFVFFSPIQTSVLGEPIGKLDDAKIQRWLALADSDRCIGEAKREICLTFSTSSNLVASFMKDSDSLNGNRADLVKVDVNRASQVFKKLLEISWIKKSMNITPLVANLVFASPVMRSPEIFMILPTCPLLHEDQNVVNLTLPLAVALTNLHDSAMKTLKDWWSTMGAPVMTKHILMWKQALSFLLRSELWLNFTPGVKAVLEVLKYLHRANKRAEAARKVPLTEFYIEEIGTTPLLLEQDVTLWRQIKWRQVQEVDLTPAIFCRYPFLLDLQSKIRIFNHDACVTKLTHQYMHEDAISGQFQNLFTWEPPTPIIQLKLRRTALLEDTFRQLASNDHDNFKKALVVKFAEDSKLTDVNKKDFFLHVFDELLAPESGMFMYNDSQTLIWFPAKPTVKAKNYFLFGILCGLALYNSNIVHMPFPLALFKKLVGIKPSLEDFTEFSPVVGKSLRYLLVDYTDDDVENMNMTFSIVWDGEAVELDQTEKGKQVTSSNKEEFVSAYVDYALNKSVEMVFEEFKRGFFKVCDRDVVEFFHPEELRGVMVGKEDYDWDTFKQNTTYNGGYHARHPKIIEFWEVFEELLDEQKKSFLLFVTGCDRVPILGMDQIRMTITVRLNSTQQHFPESLTCHTLLMLPVYESKETLRSRLVEALNHKRGFWMEETVTEDADTSSK